MKKSTLPRLPAALIQSFLLFCFPTKIATSNEFGISIVTKVICNLVKV